MHANITLKHVISKGGGAIEKLLTKYPSETVMTKVLLLVAVLLLTVVVCKDQMLDARMTSSAAERTCCA